MTWYGYASIMSAPSLWARMRAYFLGNAASKAVQAFMELKEKKLAAEDALRRGDVKKEISSKGVPLTQQGDMSMYSLSALDARRKLARHPYITRLIRQHWLMLTSHRKSDKDFLQWEEYFLYFSSCAKALMPKTKVDRARLQQEWARDSEGKDSMDFAGFFRAVFELIDQWTSTIDVKEYSNLLEFLLTSVKEQLRKIGYFQITVKEDAPHAPPPPPPLLVPALEPMEPLLLPVKLPPPQLTIEVKVPEVRMLPPHTCEKAVKVAPAQSKPQPPTPAVTHHQDGDPFRCEACRLIGLWERNRRQLLDARSARGPKPWIGAWAVKPDSYAVPVTASSLPELLPLEWPGSSSDTPWLPNRTFIDCPFTEYDSEWDDPDRLRVFHDDNEPWLEKWRQHQYKDPWLPAGCAKLPNEFYYVCDPWHRATEQAPFFRSRSSGHCEEPPSIIGGKTIVLDADRHLVDSRPHTADHTRGNSQCNFKRPSYQPEPLFTYHDHRLAEPSNAVALQTPEQTTINLSAEFAESLHPGLNRDSSSIRQDPPLALSSSFRASPSKLLVSPAKRFGKHPPSGAQQSSLGRRKNTGLPLNLKLKNLKSPFEDVSGPGNRPGLISVSSELLFQSRDTMDQPERTGLASESARLNTTLKDSAESTSTFWTMSLIPQLEPLVAHRESSVIGSSISDDSLKVATGGLSLRHHEESDAWLRSITLRPVLSTSTMSSAIPTAQHAIVHSPVRLRKKTHKPGIGVKSKLKALLSTSKPKKTRSNLKLMPTLSAKVAPL